MYWLINYFDVLSHSVSIMLHTKRMINYVFSLLLQPDVAPSHVFINQKMLDANKELNLNSISSIDDWIQKWLLNCFISSGIA